jgi:hypothetical protein
MIRTRYIALAAAFAFLAAVAAAPNEDHRIGSPLGASILAFMAVVFLAIGRLERHR